MSNQTDQDQIDQSPDVKTPFRVVDSGWSFTCEVVNRTTTDDDDNPVFHFTSRVYGWELVTGVGPICEPRPYQYDRVSGPMAELTYQGACSEYIRGDAESIAKAWLRYRKRKRNPVLYYLSASLTHFHAMTTDKQKPLTYLGDVFQGKTEIVLIAVLTLILIYSGSLKLFADWQEYGYPDEARAYANWAFYGALIVLGFLFLVPLFSKERRDTRARTQREYAERQK